MVCSTEDFITKIEWFSLFSISELAINFSGPLKRIIRAILTLDRSTVPLWVRQYSNMSWTATIITKLLTLSPFKHFFPVKCNVYCLVRDFIHSHQAKFFGNMHCIVLADTHHYFILWEWCLRVVQCCSFAWWVSIQYLSKFSLIVTSFFLNLCFLLSPHTSHSARCSSDKRQ